MIFDKLPLLGISVLLVILSGCASVPMAPKELDSAAKTFSAPPSGKSALYVFRNSSIGQALRKGVSVDGTRIGETANKVYFYKVIAPGSHTLATESEFGENSISFQSLPGKNYFARQYIKMGLFVGGSNVEMVSEEEGKREVRQCGLAQSGSGGPVLAAQQGSPASNGAPQQQSFEQTSVTPENPSSPPSTISPAKQKIKEGRFAYEAENSAKIAGCQTTDGVRPTAEAIEIKAGLEAYEIQCSQLRLTVHCDQSCKVIR